jgi:hypothetical protein
MLINVPSHADLIEFRVQSFFGIDEAEQASPKTSAKTPPGYDRIPIFARAAQATDIEQAKLRHLPLCPFRDEAPPLPEVEA